MFEKNNREKERFLATLYQDKHTGEWIMGYGSEAAGVAGGTGGVEGVKEKAGKAKTGEKTRRRKAAPTG